MDGLTLADLSKVPRQIVTSLLNSFVGDMARDIMEDLFGKVFDMIGLGIDLSFFQSLLSHASTNVLLSVFKRALERDTDFALMETKIKQLEEHLIERRLLMESKRIQLEKEVREIAKLCKGL